MILFFLRRKRGCEKVLCFKAVKFHEIILNNKRSRETFFAAGMSKNSVTTTTNNNIKKPTKAILSNKQACFSAATMDKMSYAGAILGTFSEPPLSNRTRTKFEGGFS